MSDDRNRSLNQEALIFHSTGRPGKIEVVATKPMATQRDLSLAYSPGVAEPCRIIHRDPNQVYDFTAKGNLVAVISNGTAVLGLGDLGPLGSKPVMEGKAVLFKRFADVDGIDVELDSTDVDEIIATVRVIAPTYGGINLEDIKAPECFVIEQRLRELLDIPVFHDDQHGTAIIAAAGLINACALTGRKLSDVRMVVNGAGAASIACIELVKAMGVGVNNVVMCDSKGVVYRGREEGMNQWKSAHAAETDARTLEDAMVDCDVFFGLSVAGAVTKKMVASMADNPVIFAMANPDPEITPEDIAEVRSDAIVATGRSDYANQVNNVLGFPYIFRGALDVRATTINEQMKIAAAEALADLAREDVPDEVARAYRGTRLQFGPEYIIPTPFDPRLISAIPPAVAEAAMASGVARKPIVDMENYVNELRARLDPTFGVLQLIFDEVRANPKRVVFAEGEEEKVIRAAMAFKQEGYGTPVLIGYPERVQEMIRDMGHDPDELEIVSARDFDNRETYYDFLYARWQRRGLLYRDCQRLVNTDRNVFAACMVANGDADAMVTGVTRRFSFAYEDVRRVIDPRQGQRVFGLTMLLSRGRTVFIADTTVHELPTSVELADIAVQAAAMARQMGHEPRVGLVSYSTFGNSTHVTSDNIRGAVSLLDSRELDFEYDGEMSVDVALNPELMELYPFSRLSGPANVLIMPGLQSANIAAKLLQSLGGATVLGPLLVGLSHPAQVVPIGSSVSDLVSAAALAAYDAGKN
ncbi:MULTISPECIES: NADP-dependent malic enzyme [unclassified Minwuia]|jgi:malate dehydrogenase (oxaloacetate-decarboxylating)(NADP+)|uniref:NADP-dependent malic enzyme n=1 Tax=unclassified Minwuia TaxID=2618799 RepID=UPI002479DF1C|nr:MULTISPECIES: NADP-dependent malic enzyme [unclassified Minwuia]MDF1731064.1 NADP-dependent malic enzyme [Minwuia sp.]